MKRAVSASLLCVLAACGGSGSGPVTTPGPQVQTGAQTTSNQTSGTQQATNSAPSATPPSTTATTTRNAPAGVDNTTFTGLLNDVRVANSASPVTFDARLTTAAQDHAEDMLANNYFSHTGLNGSSPGDRITAAGYRWRTYGENIARGQRSEAEVMQDWTDSPGHHANNINPNFEDFGIAKAGTGRDAHWVLVLGAER